MQNWIEFENKKGGKVLLRPELISSVADETSTTGIIRIGYDEHPLLNDEQFLTTFYECKGQYEQVKQKIVDAEKVDLNDVVVEHFTKEEYIYLQGLMAAHLNKLKQEGDIEASSKNSFQSNLLYKLNKILNEEK